MGLVKQHWQVEHSTVLTQGDQGNLGMWEEVWTTTNEQSACDLQRKGSSFELAELVVQGFIKLKLKPGILSFKVKKSWHCGEIASSKGWKREGQQRVPFRGGSQTEYEEHRQNQNFFLETLLFFTLILHRTDMSHPVCPMSSPLSLLREAFGQNQVA